MAQAVMGIVVVLIGLVAAGVGAIVASQRLRAARRTYRKTTSLAQATPEGWGTWFLGGFSGVALGVRWLAAAAIWLLWTLAGAWFIGLGIRLVGRQ
jgi:hypothetical protein